MRGGRRRFFNSRRNSALVLGLSIMVLSWVADAVLDAAFEPQSLLNQLFRPGYHETALRLWFLATLLFGIHYLYRFRRLQRLQDVHQKALAGAEAERAKWQAVVDKAGDAISMQDLDLKIIYQNQAHRTLMGDHLGEYCYAAYQQQEAPCPGCHLVQCFTDAQPRRTERHAATTNGIRCAEIIATPLHDPSGRIVAGIESVRDVTDRVRGDLEVERLNRELELRALELCEANAGLESFNYSLSHDLRSYLTRISTAQQILSQAPEAKGGDLEYLVQVIEESCRGMEGMIEAMLTLSRLSRETVRWEEVPLGELARELALQLQHGEPQRQVEFVIAEPLVLWGDRHLLRVVLENLLGNAWKYTRAVARGRIEVGVTRVAEGELCFVRDNGIGFDMAERDKLFKPFQRLRNAQGIPGTGIGLATVQRAIQCHGGTVWGEGVLGKGATIYFTVPRPGPAPPSATEGAPRQKRGTLTG